jgi:hypothetical protein
MHISFPNLPTLIFNTLQFILCVFLIITSINIQSIPLGIFALILYGINVSIDTI